VTGANLTHTEVNGMIHYPFPLSNGQVATFLIPKEITDEDAERLAEFIQTLVIGDR